MIRILPSVGRSALAVMLLQAVFALCARAEFHLPWQRRSDPPLCESSQGCGYFRPEYGELAQRLDPEKLDWVVRNFSVLGWQGMDSRLYTPKPVPGTTGREGFRYDSIRRHLELEALFHFGPVGGNGTLIEDALWLDSRRLLTVNRGSDNISLVDIGKPDVLGTFEAPRGIVAFELNREAGELYLLERGARGMLVFPLDGAAARGDTMLLDFVPGAVLQPPGGRYLYLTDEDAARLVRIDLSGQGDPVSLAVDLRPPLFIAAHTGSETLVLVSRADGRIRLVDTRNFSLRPSRLSAGKPVTRLAVSGDNEQLYLVSAADCDRSEIHGLSVDKRSFTLRRLASLSGVVRDLAAAEGGRELFAVAGDFLYRVGAKGAKGPRRVRIGEEVRGVAVDQDRVFVSAGLDHVYALDHEFRQQPERVRVELGPGPLLVRDGKLYVLNCLSNSITVLDGKDLEEEVSVLLGVLLGRMYYKDSRIVVNNLFRGNVMVLDPETYRIEEILRSGGSIDYDSVTNAFVVFDDSLVTRWPSPPSAAAPGSYMDLPDGVRLFAPAGKTDLYLLADQNRFASRIDISGNLRRGQIPLPSPALGIAVRGDTAYVMAENELYRYNVDDNVGLDRSWSVRPKRFIPPWLAAENFSPGRGMLLKYVRRDRLLDVFTTRGDISAIRNDPDTTLSWVAAGGALYVFDTGTAKMLATFRLRWNIIDIVLPHLGRNAYAVTTDQVVAFDRRTLLRYDDVSAGGEVVYSRGDDLFLMHPDYPRTLVVVDGQRGRVYQELELPVVPTDAVASGERLFLLGATQGALAIYVNIVKSARLPRSDDRGAWDPQADSRAGYHR